MPISLVVWYEHLANNLKLWGSIPSRDKPVSEMLLLNQTWFMRPTESIWNSTKIHPKFEFRSVPWTIILQDTSIGSSDAYILMIILRVSLALSLTIPFVHKKFQQYFSYLQQSPQNASYSFYHPIHIIFNYISSHSSDSF